MASLDLKQKRDKYRRSLENALDKIIQRLEEMPDVELAILFGSYAKGRRDLFTDLDILVAMHTHQDIAHRTANLLQEFQPDVDLDLIVYTPDEFKQMGESAFLRNVLENGQVIYEKQRS